MNTFSPFFPSEMGELKGIPLPEIIFLHRISDDSIVRRGETFARSMEILRGSVDVLTHGGCAKSLSEKHRIAKGIRARVSFAYENRVIHGLPPSESAILRIFRAC